MSIPLILTDKSNYNAILNSFDVSFFTHSNKVMIEKNTDQERDTNRKPPTVILQIETSRGHGRALLRGVAKYAQIHGPWIIHNEALSPYYGDDQQRRLMSIKQMTNINPDGIITRDPQRVRPLIELGVPTIIAIQQEMPIPDTHGITLNHHAIGKMAAEHFIQQGFRNFAYCGFANMFWSHNRETGFRDRIADAGFDIHIYEPSKNHLNLSWNRRQKHLAAWLESLPKPIGIMACNDDRGCQVIEGCKMTPYHSPDDIAILGVDNDEMICELTDPPLSSISLNVQYAGYETAEMLDKLMKGENPDNNHIIIEPIQVIARQSTNVLAIDDAEVAHALRFIYENTREPIQVNDVANHMTLSRRSLESRFRSVLGRSIHETIRKIRVEKICQMLIETDMTISQIAKAFGYSGEHHIARFFRLEKGVSPLTYRKQHARK